MADNFMGYPNNLAQNDTGLMLTPNVSALDTKQLTQTNTYILELAADANIDDAAKTTALPSDKLAGPAVDITSFGLCFSKPIDSLVSGPTNATGRVSASAVKIVLATGPHMPILLQWLHQNKYLDKVGVHKIVLLGSLEKPIISESFIFSKAKVAQIVLGTEQGAALTIMYTGVAVNVRPIDRSTGVIGGTVSFEYDYSLNAGGTSIL